LIAEKKNLYLLLQALENTAGITLDIYGPVKDKGYWKLCEKRITLMHDIVTYRGDVKPSQVQQTLSEYDALALLTKGENFGHAIYESLSAGSPVITSNYTPWQNLEAQSAGWNVDLDVQAIRQLFENIKLANQQQHQLFCEGAYQLATTYYNNMDIDKRYSAVFNNQQNKK
jgi:glycosyltransferase involved in cell wall biosynthesis